MDSTQVTARCLQLRSMPLMPKEPCGEETTTVEPIRCTLNLSQDKETSDEPKRSYGNPTRSSSRSCSLRRWPWLDFSKFCWRDWSGYHHPWCRRLVGLD